MASLVEATEERCHPIEALCEQLLEGVLRSATTHPKHEKVRERAAKAPHKQGDHPGQRVDNVLWHGAAARLRRHHTSRETTRVSEGPKAHRFGHVARVVRSARRHMIATVSPWNAPRLQGAKNLSASLLAKRKVRPLIHSEREVGMVAVSGRTSPRIPLDRCPANP